MSNRRAQQGGGGGAANAWDQIAGSLADFNNQHIQQQYLKLQMGAQQREQDEARGKKQAALNSLDGLTQTFKSDPILSEAIDPVTKANMERYEAARAQFAKAQGDARIKPEQLAQMSEQLGSQAVNIEFSLREAQERGFKAQGLNAARAAIEMLPEEDRPYQSAMLDAAVKATAAGIDANGLAALLRNLNPSLLDRANTSEATIRAARATSDHEADKVASPVLLDQWRKLGILVPESMNGITIFGAGGKLSDLNNSIAESDMFRANSDRAHGQRITEIQARGAQERALAGVDWQRTLMDRYSNILQFGRTVPGGTGPGASGGVGKQAPSSPEEALAWVFEDFDPLLRQHPELKAQVIAEFQNIDRQVMNDFAYYNGQGVGAEEYVRMMQNAPPDAARDPAQVAEVARRLRQEEQYRTGRNNLQPSARGSAAVQGTRPFQR